MRATTRRAASRGIAAIVLLVAGCTSVQLVSRYDEATDQAANALQRKLDAYFVALQNTPAEQRKFRNQQKFYEGVVVDLDSLDVRAAGIYKNAPTREQLRLVRDNLAYVVLLHKGCIAGPLSDGQKQAVKDNGVDLSLDCRKDSGATSDLPDRGEQALNPALVGTTRDLFNQQLGAVIALELAKKRGEQ